MVAISLAPRSIGSNSSPNTLTAISARYPREQLVGAHLDRLAEFIAAARQCLYGAFDLRKRASPCPCPGRAIGFSGFRIMNVSEALGGIGSVAISAVPVLE